MLYVTSINISKCYHAFKFPIITEGRGYKNNNKDAQMGKGRLKTFAVTNIQ